MADLPAPIGPSAPTTRKSEGLTRMDERGRGGREGDKKVRRPNENGKKMA